MMLSLNALSKESSSFCETAFLPPFDTELRDCQGRLMNRDEVHTHITKNHTRSASSSGVSGSLTITSS